MHSTRIIPQRYQEIWDILGTVMDPEIPMISLVELGVIEEVVCTEQTVRVAMIPTFSGCPALDVMKEDISRKLSDAGYTAEVRILNKPWSTDRISDTAREKMKRVGLAPPLRHNGKIEWEMHTPIPCPWCDSTDTQIENHFGPTLCRAIYYCNNCLQPFERFKQL